MIELGESNFDSGNAFTEGAGARGWIVGNFIEPGSNLRHSSDVEVKWGHHEPGDGESHWTANAASTTISILVSGRITISLPDTQLTLEKVGDYAVWAPGIPHRWRAETRSVVVSIRWPSIPDDQYIVEDEGTQRKCQ
jgi:uncharacterized cupin superfamily protein